MTVKPHHFPNELTEKIHNLVKNEGELPASQVADKLNITVSEVCTACVDDMRIVHTFKADQQYYISGRDSNAA